LLITTPTVEDRPWTRVSAHGLCVVEGRLLVVRLAPPVPDAGAWGLPGGGLEWGEAPEDAVVREVREETGLKATPSGLAGVYSTTFLRSAVRPLDSVHFISVVFWLNVAEGDLEYERDGTTDLAAWVPLEEIGALPLGALAEFGLALISEQPTRN
jgi:8-oxo-dGTP diphosphatase